MSSDKELQYKKCPRCEGEWQRANVTATILTAFACSNCGLQYFDDLQGNTHLVFDDRHNGITLSWNVNEKTCYYESAHSDALWPERLPWLPFTIATDKLKLYLTFT